MRSKPPVWFLEFLMAAVLSLALPTHASSIDNDDCLDCHEGEEADEVDPERFALSVHGENYCVDCHRDATPDHDELDETLAPADCRECHASELDAYSRGIHGELWQEGDEDAPDCRFCHGTHETRSKTDPASPTFPLKVPALCGECHRHGEKSAVREAATQTHILENYTMSIHGKGLLKSGLVVSATCTSCHTAHAELPAKDPRSSVHSANVASTCGSCHYGISEQLRASVHSPEVTQTDETLPTCNDCHLSHVIKRVEWTPFRFEILKQCGECHAELIETYFDTYHGKASKLGGTRTARCHDCHGSHQIFPRSDPRSTLHADHVVETCKACHPGSNTNFVQYYTHASRHDRERFPQLYYSYAFMTALLVGTIGFFGLHTLLWLVRSLVVRGEAQEAETPVETRYFRRFEPVHIVLHLMVIVSFITLVFTGMSLKYPDTAFFASFTRFLGGPEVAARLHRIGAIVTFLYFAIHLGMVARKLQRREISLKGLVREDYSLVPRWIDLRELKAHFLWFFGVGSRPRFGRWTYWEKFDYLAVFWGVTVIGLTGLIMWFPEAVTRVLPGWVINVSSVVHSDEALLAAAFIFTVHFFNTHIRPTKFPLDPVIFTGRTRLDKFREEHPREYDRLVARGELERFLVGPPLRWQWVSGWIVGILALSSGIAAIVAIVYSIVIH